MSMMDQDGFFCESLTSTLFVLCYFGCDVLIVGLNVLMSLLYQTDFPFFQLLLSF